MQGNKTMNTPEQIRLICEQLFEQGNTDNIDIFFDELYCAHDGDKMYKGKKFVKSFIKKLRHAIRDIKIRKIEILSQSKNTISWQRSFIGTHKFEMQGIPASDKKIKWNEIVVTRFSNGKIAEEWIVSNLAFNLTMHLPKKE